MVGDQSWAADGQHPSFDDAAALGFALVPQQPLASRALAAVLPAFGLAGMSWYARNGSPCSSTIGRATPMATSPCTMATSS